MADLKTTNIYGDAYINNKVGINTNTPATRLQIGQLSPTAATEGLQFGDDTGARLYRGGSSIVQAAAGFQAGAQIYAATYLQSGNSQIYPSSYSATQRIGIGNSANNAWIDGITIAPGGNVTIYNSLTSSNISTTVDGTNITMAGTANAEGIRMQAASSTTYPVFLRSINPGSGGESSPWIYKEAATDWGIWHNNPINSIDFTKAGSGGIASNVGGSSSNTVTVRVEMATGFVQTIAGYRNSAGTTILSDSGNITGTSTNITAYTINQNLGTTNSPTFAAITGTGALTIGNSLTRPASLATLNNYAARIGGSDVYLNIASLDATYSYPVAIQSGRNSDNANFPLLLNPNGGNITVGQYTGLGYTFGVAGTGYFSSSLTVGGPITGSAFSGAGTGLTGTAANLTVGTATSANSLNASNSYTGVNFIATGYFQTNLGQIKSDSSFALLTTGNGAQSVSAKGILLGTSYDTTPGANEIRTTNNTSLYLNARGTGDIQFQTADSLKMMLLNNGNVGIGISSPVAKLHVIGDISGSGQVRAPSFYSNGAAGTCYFETLNIGTGVYIEGGANEGLYIGDSNRWIIDTCNAAHSDNADGELHFRDYTNSITRMLIQYSTGNIGMGITTPSASLHIKSTTSGAT